MSDFLIGALGLIIGIVTTYFTMKYNYNQLFAETISKSRNHWLNEFREELSIIVGTAFFINNKQGAKCKNEFCEKVLEAEKARVKLLTRLNQNVGKYGNEFNKILQDELVKINFFNGIKEEDLIKLVNISREILEFEWEKVKREAKGEK